MKIRLELINLDPPNMSPVPSSPLVTYRFGHSWRLWWRAWPFGSLSWGSTWLWSQSSPIPSSSPSGNFVEGGPWLQGASLSRKRPCLLGENQFWSLLRLWPCAFRGGTLHRCWVALNVILLPHKNSLPWNYFSLQASPIINGWRHWRYSRWWRWHSHWGHLLWINAYCLRREIWGC